MTTPPVPASPARRLCALVWADPEALKGETP